MLTNQTIDPNQAGQPKPFILFRPFIAVWHWLVPPTQAHRDRQSTASRWIAAASVTVVCLTIIVLGFIYARPLHDQYQGWQADRLVEESRQMAEDGQAVNAVMKAQQAVSIAPDNINAIRLNTEYLTLMKRTEALYFLDRLDQKGATTPKDKQTRVRALMNLNRSQEAAEILEDILEDTPADGALMKLAQDVWGDQQKNERLLKSLKAYAEKHPEDTDHQLRLAKVQLDSESLTERAEGMRMAWRLAKVDDKNGLQALEILDGFESLPLDESSNLVKRLREHPLADGWHFVAALKRQLQLEPNRRSSLIQEAIDHSQGKEREALVPLVRWLVEQKEFLQVLTLVPEEQAKSYQPLLENYLTALTMLQRFDDLERLVSDAKVEAILNQSVRAFYKAHLAFVMRKPAAEVRKALTSAKSAAELERRGELSIKIAEYAEARGHFDIAQEAYQSATKNPRTDRQAYQGLLRTSELNENTDSMLTAATEAVRRWPDDPLYLESFLYVNLLTGRQVELSLSEARRLVELQPADHTRRLMVALGNWRMMDSATATGFLQNMELRELSPGQRAVFAAIARDSGTTNAEQAARSVVNEIDPKAKMLPEERACLAKATR